LPHFIEQIIQQFTPYAQQKGVDLKLFNEASRQVILCDQDKMEKAISNLLKNAIEHSKKGGSVTIQLQEKKDKHLDELIILVEDEGKGISAEHLPHLFDRFYQIDQHGKRGSGIGLALTKQVVELHQGCIEVESKINKGSCFKITLPILKIQNGQSANGTRKNHLPEEVIDLPAQSRGVIIDETKWITSKQESQLTGIEILVVEDNPDFNQYLCRRLSEKGYQVSTAMDGLQALSYLSQNLPELIISDVMMPHLNGFELLQQVKKEVRTAHIPIILLTAKVNQNDKMEGLEFGADAYLTKPFHVEELLLRSRNLILQRKELKESFLRNPFSQVKKVSINKLDEKLLNRALDIVEKRMEDTEFNVEKFCREMGMSRTNLYNKLKALTGQNISNFIRTIRLRRAAQLIETNSGNIIEIASRVGFNTRQSFNKSFKDFYGVSPSEFRKKRIKAKSI